jgi:hypothetical protein
MHGKDEDHGAQHPSDSEEVVFPLAMPSRRSKDSVDIWIAFAWPGKNALMSDEL